MKPANKPKIRVVSAVIEHDGCYLITQRAPKAVLPLYWEFPGGKVEPDETDAEALRRELDERLGVAVEIGALIGTKHHAYPDYDIELHLYRATIHKGPPQARNVHTFRWVSSAKLSEYPFPPADAAHTAALLNHDHDAS
jgi:8-oxo-dGTP diphosphatase